MILQPKQSLPVEAISNVIMPPVTIGERLADLKKRGYKYKFRREANCLYCIDLGSWFMPDGFTVDEYYHFDDHSNTHGDRMLYAVSSVYGLNGFLIDTCFVYEGSTSLDMPEQPELEYALVEEY